MDKKGYELRQRKNPPTKTQHPSIKKSVTHKRPKMEVDLGTIQMKDILKQENGTVNAGFSDEDEENTLFDQTPLLSRDEICASPDVLIEEDNREIKVDESWWTIGLQVFFPFIIAGFGTVGAGMVLDIVQVNEELLYYMYNCVMFHTDFQVTPSPPKVLMGFVLLSL